MIALKPVRWVCYSIFSVLISGCLFDEKVDDALVKGTGLFDINSVLTYDINLNELDWAALSYQGKTLSILAEGCNEFTGYSQYRGRVSVDGATLYDVQIRKKGGLGSLSSVRPSLKIDVGSGKINDGRTLRGERYVTLNNNHQSPAIIEQCLSYHVFRQAGIKAPKCNFARVKAQGKDKGIYTHVEDIKNPFLEREFGIAGGNLFEANEADFTSVMAARFEKKSTNDNLDRSILQSVVDVLASTSTNLYADLDQYIDMESFVTFAAVEALIGHSDSYTGGQSNLYLYQNPSDNRLHFIPWGTDQTFKDRLGSGYPESVYLGNHLMKALWADADFRQRYDTQMQTLLDDVWNETELKALADQYASLVNAPSQFVTDVKNFIDQQRSKIVAELGDDTRSWPKPVPNIIPVYDTSECQTLDTISGTFEGTVLGYQAFDFDAEFSFDYTVDDEEVTLASAVGTFQTNLWAGRDDTLTEQHYSVGKISFSQTLEDGDVRWITLVVPFDVFTMGEHPLHAFDTFGVYGTNNLGFQGFIGDGVLRLERASLQTGSALKGTLNAKLVPQ